MQTIDAHLLSRAQNAHETSRARLGLFAAALATVAPVSAAVIHFQGLTTLSLGLALQFTIGVLVWRGGGLSLGAISGLKAGLVPLVLSLAANAWGHVCIPGRGCSSLCIPACTVGGVLAGLAVEYCARGTRSPWRVRAGGAVVALLVGSLGCACVGYAGIAGLLAGTVVSLTAGSALAPRRAQ